MAAGPQIRAAVEELLAQLDHADQLITEQAERIAALEAEVEMLRTRAADTTGAAA